MLMSLASTPLPSPSLPWQSAQSVAPYKRVPSAIDAGLASTGFLRSTSSCGIFTSAGFPEQPSSPAQYSAQNSAHQAAPRHVLTLSSGLNSPSAHAALPGADLPSAGT